MNQNKKKMMKSKLKYYAQVIGVNLLAILVPLLAVVLIYALGKLKNIYTHPCILSQEIYDCCLEAVIVVMAGFFVGFWLLSWADNWRKSWLTGLRIKNEFDELGIRVVVKKIYPNEERTEQKNIPTSDDSEFEDISGLTVKEIYHLYQGREVLITTGIQAKKGGRYCGRLAGYDNEGSILYIGFPSCYVGPYSLDDINAMRDTNPEVSYVEPGYKNYGCYIPRLIRIYK
jgi:hypothetical protein|uniref:Uncharacterized protein n=2 Tax=unclassified Caudoviricetes TaxID=2788787 RepID=A0A8S5VBB0_9CAUD|nr:MAG TPA: hypothetical protein [Siphoviridae sp. ctfrT39]DAG03891.1 MAG TPA: hypothetical protein [Siphoviridae sp. ct0vA12]